MSRSVEPLAHGQKLRAWRIAKARHAARAFSGEGAAAFGGRWNSPGAPVVYAAGSVSLAMLELLVHIRRPELLFRYVAWELTFEESLVETLDPTQLPKNWRTSPPPAAVQRLGDRWLAEGHTAILRVPSAIVSIESNFLINPRHPDFQKIGIGRKRNLRFDARILPQ